MQYGGISKVPTLRLFKADSGHIEQRWMDEHIVVKGRVENIDADLIGWNCKSLSWWTDKHNAYSSREAVDLLNARYHFLGLDDMHNGSIGQAASFKRSVKTNLYIYLPPEIRSILYFFYRYFLLLGFLDGRSGLAFHILQGFWYRYLADLKAIEIVRYKTSNSCSWEVAIHKVTSLKIQF